MTQSPQNHSMKAFTTIWLGELLSIIGSGITTFGLGVWIYQLTNSATLFALITLAATLPAIVISPVIGALVDRWDARRVMLFSDIGAALATLAIAILIWTDQLAIWHIYVAMGAASICNAFQQPAYQVAATMLVPKKFYASASGMMQSGMGAQYIISPVLAGSLIGLIGIHGIILIDFITFFFALFALYIVRIPRPEATAEGQKGRGSLWQEVAQSWYYLRDRPGLSRLMVIIASGNFMIGFLAVLAGPMMLSLFGSPTILGITMSVAGSGMLIGSIALAATGGPKKLVQGLFISMIIGGLGIFAMGLRPNVVLITASCFTFFLMMPIGRGCFETLLRLKVVPDMQGRMFSFTRMIAMFSTTLAYVAAGPLTDQVFEPLMRADGPLASSIGQIIGVGPGRGIGLLLIISGALIVVITAAGYSSTRVRRIEEELPDVVADDLTLTEPQLSF
ncbi:MAG: putative arabinose efflux permease, MFS family [Chloroflexi bacterium AL-W]|nr:putative arabinose efflux permease, MFS family [Chloroflexi bacterium AL-N1]NOK64607.1 putative arabinose efflux permease, MFS family [Chloroflexi bacterium AL-N10]NOK75848.1 putative arabinose efflux permease, MFS family [Chloroflexi bacterium AL-N5]NOK80393.1 putative arabinose efflux permease, MFS family [Chloroflexi bacterium AL-W]NOK86907.1 putative arabinose efflux permease, MFS family [Chloroflexi bacterium AL-N15]